MTDLIVRSTVDLLNGDQVLRVVYDWEIDISSGRVNN